MALSDDPAIAGLFAGGGGNALAILDAVMAALSPLGPVEVELKKTCIHLCRGPAFAGVHPRKTGVLMTIKSAGAIDSPRVRKVDMTSASRAYNDLLISNPAEVDGELAAWLAAAYALYDVKA
jgi:hypothetical protein